MFTKQQITATMKKTGLVPLFTHDNVEDATNALQAVYDGGVRVFEFTNRRVNSFEVFSELVKQRSAKYPDLMLGIGTIMDGTTAQKFIDAGADFIISPIMKVEMGEVCKRNDKHWIPGCATLTEIVTAREQGAEIIKVFPGSVLGPGFVSSILPVIPDLKLMITGGVEPNEDNLIAWFKSGAMCVGMGSLLFTKGILENKDWSLLQHKVKNLLHVIEYIRK